MIQSSFTMLFILFGQKKLNSFIQINMTNLHQIFTFSFLFLSISIQSSVSQPQPFPTICNEILISYTYNSNSNSSHPLPPILTPTDPTHQAYKFESTLTILNNGLDELKSWRVFVAFQNKEILVSASQAVLADGTSLPADVSNGTVFAGYPVTDLKSAVLTAGDYNQMQAQVQLVGTQFGVAAPNSSLPASITLASDGFLCSAADKQDNNTMRVCCTKDPSAVSNVTLDEEFLPRQEGDLIIMYDILRAYETSYYAQVSISNHNPIGRLDNWHLSWDWMNGEFINTIRGAYPFVVDTTDCIFGPQGEIYKEIDFGKVLNCQRTPTIIDLPLQKTNDTDLGLIPFCCRNGTILPQSMDSKRSTSAFQIEVYKMPPNLNRTQFNPPQNWKINGTSLNPNYQCGQPVRVNPSMFPDPRGLPSDTSAVASWQVVCNITKVNPEPPKCCVSFSAFYNDSVIPCNTCACGCNANQENDCSATSEALLLPSEALLVPFKNRTKTALAFSKLQRWKVPDPLPCPDNCGVSINWHLLTDYEKGWTARMTLFNWGESDFADWFAAVELDKGVAGFEKAYSFNGSIISSSNNTIFMQGLQDFNYLVKERDGKNPKKDPRIPGSQQSVISFTKKKTPGIKVAKGDGFPSKVYFNGEECSLPSFIPSNSDHGIGEVTSIISSLLALLVLIFLQQ